MATVIPPGWGLEGSIHQHVVIRINGPFDFEGCINESECNKLAHDAYMEEEVCYCGAIRMINFNLEYHDNSDVLKESHEEYGPWINSTAQED